MYPTQSDPQDSQNSQDGQDQSQNQQEMTPLDEIIGRVQSYIKDPKQVTPQTMTDLLTDLQDLKGVVDGDDSQAPQEDNSAVGNSIRQRMSMPGGGQ